MDVQVVVEGVIDPRVVTTLEKAVRDVFARIPHAAGAWIVGIAPGDTRGRWDLGVRGPGCRHVASFSAAAARVPELVADKLARFLRSGT